MLTKKDYLLVSIIGACFALFSVPILKNLDLFILEQFPFTIQNILILVIFFATFANSALWIASIINKKVSVALQFAKFGAVGAFNTFLDWGVLNILMLITGLVAGPAYSLFKGISFIIAAISAYFWNKHWTFDSKKKADSKEVLRFITVTVIGGIINISISTKQLANIGAALATIISLIWNFIGYKIFVFKK